MSVEDLIVVHDLKNKQHDISPAAIRQELWVRENDKQTREMVKLSRETAALNREMVKLSRETAALNREMVKLSRETQGLNQEMVNANREMVKLSRETQGLNQEMVNVNLEMVKLTKCIFWLTIANLLMMGISVVFSVAAWLKG